MGDRRKRRSWSDEEKREICRQALAKGVPVSQVARRYVMNANMIHNWLKDERFAPVASNSSDSDRPEVCLPVEIKAGLPVDDMADGSMPGVPHSAPLSATRVDITLSDGRRILVEGPTALPAVLGLVEGLQF